MTNHTRTRVRVCTAAAYGASAGTGGDAPPTQTLPPEHLPRRDRTYRRQDEMADHVSPLSRLGFTLRLARFMKEE
jgi:hypothetical protein